MRTDYRSIAQIATPISAETHLHQYDLAGTSGCDILARSNGLGAGAGFDTVSIEMITEVFCDS
jgi:hypothetical protein